MKKCIYLSPRRTNVKNLEDFDKYFTKAVYAKYVWFYGKENFDC